MPTELILDTSNTGDLSRTFVRDGIAGNYEVVYAMIRMIRYSVNYDRGFEAFAKNLLISNRQDGYSATADKLTRVYDFVKLNVKYIQDIAGRIESLKDARATLSDGFGDCDDHTVLVATILGCLGFEDVRIALAKYSQTDTSFAHVYCVCYQDGKRFVLDTTLPNGQLNKEIKAAEIKEIGVFSQVAGLDGFSGLYTGARYAGRKIAQAAIQLGPQIVGQLPLGFVAGKAFETGAQMIGSGVNDSNSLSFNAIVSKVNKNLDSLFLSLCHSRISLEVAQAQALQYVSQLSAVEYKRVSPEDYTTLKESVKIKLDRIKNFTEYATANNIPVIHLHPQMMLASGVALTGLVAWFFWSNYKRVR